MNEHLPTLSHVLNIVLKWLSLLKIPATARPSGMPALLQQMAEDDVLQRVSGQRLRVFTVKEWFNHFAKQKRKSKSEKTALRHEQMHEEFLAFLGPRANLNIAAIAQRTFLISETNAKRKDSRR
jgi:hypothetical protein